MVCCGPIEAQSRPHHAPPMAHEYHVNDIRQSRGGPFVENPAALQQARIVHNASDHSCRFPAYE